jgi:hypothetical protein
MYLSADALRDLMKRAASQAVQSAQAGHGEKRRADRILSRSQVAIVYGGATTNANLADVSQRGLCIFSHTKMKRNDTFILRLHSDTSPAQILCTVVHCRPINPDVNKIGAEFTCTLPAERTLAPAHATASSTPTQQKTAAQSVQDEVSRIQHSILD